MTDCGRLSAWVHQGGSTSFRTRLICGSRTTRPDRGDWDRFRQDPLSGEYVAERGTGRAMVLWKDGTPSEIGFWGYSGD